MLRNSLVRRYVGFEDMVSAYPGLCLAAGSDLLQIMLMEIALDVSMKRKDDDYGNDGETERTHTPDAATAFLKEFPTAKIIVIIDTHSSDGGFFLWKGNREGEFDTSPLLPVRITHC